MASLTATGISLLMRGRPALVTITEDLPKEPTAPAQARRLLDRFDGQMPPECLDDARLMVSELVANAVEHVAVDGEIQVSVSLDGRRLRVDVADPGSGFTPHERDPTSARGWGLQFVRALADRWGVERSPGARVWFELTA